MLGRLHGLGTTSKPVPTQGAVLPVPVPVPPPVPEPVLVPVDVQVLVPVDVLWTCRCWVPVDVPVELPVPVPVEEPVELPVPGVGVDLSPLHATSAPRQSRWKTSFNGTSAAQLTRWVRRSEAARGGQPSFGAPSAPRRA